jgi:uncharacterized protein YceK
VRLLSGVSMGRQRVVLKQLSIAVLLLISIAGCQTTHSWNHDCPGVYSGVRYFASQRDSLPWDGKVFFTLDLPLTAVLDTLLLPASAFVDPVEPESGWVPGCRWAG